MRACSSSAADPFTFGFERILDGLAAYLDRARPADGTRAARAAWATLDDADVAGDKKVREAQKAVRDAEKALRDARKLERQSPRARRASDARAGIHSA